MLTVARLPFDAAARHGDRPAMRSRKGPGWEDTSYAELERVVVELAAGLMASGVQRGDRVALLSNTRPEWTLVDLAASCAGAIVVPIYPTSSTEECDWVLTDSGASVLVVEGQRRLEMLGDLGGRVPSVRTVLTIDGGAFDELRALGRTVAAEDVRRRAEAVQAEDPFTFIYTSGTTGPPKGCVLTHANLGFVIDVLANNEVVSPGDTVFLHLPLAHVFARVTEVGCFALGATLAYSGGDPTQLLAELAEVKPTFLPTVPRVFEKLYTFATATATATAGVDAGEAHARARAVFGGRIRQCVTGAAPIAPEILEFFAEAGVPVLEGYGMTETTAVITSSTLADHRFGTVGRVVAGVDLRVADDGELLVRGPNVMAGYHANEVATEDAIRDGWLHTGDLGQVDDDGYVTITGRKKDIIITAGGKNLAPANLENALKRSRWISQAVMFGDRRPYPVALITLDEVEIAAWAREVGLSTDLATLSRHPDVRRLVEDVLDEANTHHAPVGQIKRFAILDRDLTQDAGELTPTLKVKRAVVHANHAAVFASLYES